MILRHLILFFALLLTDALAFCPALPPMVVANVPLKDVTTGAVTVTDWVFAMSTTSFAFPPGDQYPSPCANEESFISSQVARYDRNPNLNPAVPISGGNGNCTAKYDHRVSWVDLSSGGCTYRVVNQNSSAIAAINIQCGLTSGILHPSALQTSLYNSPFSFSSLWFTSAIMCQTVSADVLPTPPSSYPLIPGTLFITNTSSASTPFIVNDNPGGYNYRRSYPPCGALWTNNYISATMRAATNLRIQKSLPSAQTQQKEHAISAEASALVALLSPEQQSRATELLKKGHMSTDTLRSVVDYIQSRAQRRQSLDASEDRLFTHGNGTTNNGTKSDYQTLFFLCTFACGHPFGDTVSTLQQLIMFNQLITLAQYVIGDTVIQPPITGVVFDAFTVNAAGGIDTIDDSTPLDSLLTSSDCLGGQQTGMFSLIGAIHLWRGYRSYLAPTTSRNVSQPWDPRDFPPNPTCTDRMTRLRLLLNDVNGSIVYFFSQQFDPNATSINGFYVDLDPGADCASLITDSDRLQYTAFLAQFNAFVGNYFGGGLLNVFVAVGASALTKAGGGVASPNLWTSSTSANVAFSDIISRVGEALKPQLVSPTTLLGHSRSTAETLSGSAKTASTQESYFVPQLVMIDTSTIMRYDIRNNGSNTLYSSQLFDSVVDLYIDSVAPLSSTCGAQYIVSDESPSVMDFPRECVERPRAIIGVSSDLSANASNLNVTTYFSVLKAKGACQLFIDARDVVDPTGNLGNAYTISTSFLKALEEHQWTCWNQ